jgi:hypothetical protein
MRRPLLLLLLLCWALSPAAGEAQESHLEWRAVAEAALARKDYAAARSAFLSALDLRPDSARYRYGLAVTAAAAGDTPTALENLHEMATLGVFAPIARDPAFASLQAEPGFRRVLGEFASNQAPHGTVSTFAELPAQTGIVEGLAYRERTGDLFFSDVHHRTIWRRDHTGRIVRFTQENEEIFGLFGLALDERRDALWAAATALPAMEGYQPDQKGHAALAEFELSTGRLRRLVPVPVDGRDHALGDLTVDDSGNVYATDSLAPVIWQVSVGQEEMEKTIESPAFHSLQGIVVFQRTLFVSDYAHGLFTVDLARRTARLLEPPEHTTLLGIDGLVTVPGGLVAVQNGITPSRVVRIELAPDLQKVAGLAILAANLPHLEDLTLVTVVQDRPTFVAGAGWEGFDPERQPHPRTRSVWILQTSLP